jgi:hypothetical protein
MSHIPRPKLGSGLNPDFPPDFPPDFAPSVPAYLIPSNTETKVDSEYNIAIGLNALVNNLNVSYNMNDGSYSSLPNLTGVNNTAVGDSSLHDTKGKNNTALGYKTGISNIVGNNNTFLGNSADCVGNNLNNSTAIGYKSKITASNQIVLGNNDTTQVFIPSETASIQLGSTLLDQDMINSFASETYVDGKITELKNGAGSAFDTLKEIADIIGDNTSLVGTLISSIAGKAPLASPTFTGIVTVVDISGITQAMIGLEHVNNTSDTSKVQSGPIKDALDLKANTSDVASSLDLKANASDVASSLDLKANASDVASSLDLKANTSDVASSLDLKANASDVASSLDLKANTSESAYYLYNSANFNLNDLTANPDKIYNVVNINTTTIIVTYGTQSQTLNLESRRYASFIYNNNEWYRVIYLQD